MARLEDLRKDFAEFRTEIRESQKNTVPRSEYEEYKKGVADKFKEIEARRAPWWVIAGIGLSIVTAIVAVFNLMTKIGGQ